MAFWAEVIRTVFKMLFIAVFAGLGIFTGKKLRDRSDAKKEAEQK